MLKLKSKSSDLDGISAHHLRCDCPALVAQLQLLFQFCLSLSMVPDSFLCGTVTSILKRGRDPFDCSSHRPITVLAVLVRFLNKFCCSHILLNELRKTQTNLDFNLVLGVNMRIRFQLQLFMMPSLKVMNYIFALWICLKPSIVSAMHKCGTFCQSLE